MASLFILFTSILKNRVLSEIKYFVFLLCIALLVFYLKSHFQIQDPISICFLLEAANLDFHIYVCDSLVIYVCGTPEACKQIPSIHSIPFILEGRLPFAIGLLHCVHLFLGPSFSLFCYFYC